MGIVWETDHKGVPLLGVPENSTEQVGMTIFDHVTNGNKCILFVGWPKSSEASECSKIFVGTCCLF